jgi:hypothetical protein
MNKKIFTPQQIAKLLQEFADGKSIADISQELGGCQAAFYKWRQRCNWVSPNCLTEPDTPNIVLGSVFTISSNNKVVVTIRTGWL